MVGLRILLRAIAALAFILALAATPAVEIVSHGPTALAAEADHAAWHAERGEPWQSETHGHHDATDHDHSVSVVLNGQKTYAIAWRSAGLSIDHHLMHGALGDLPPRPPRGADLSA